MFPPQLLPLVLSAIVGYGRPIILSQEGAVTLSGVVQTIVKEETANGITLLFKNWLLVGLLFKELAKGRTFI